MPLINLNLIKSKFSKLSSFSKNMSMFMPYGRYIFVSVSPSQSQFSYSKCQKDFFETYFWRFPNQSPHISCFFFVFGNTNSVKKYTWIILISLFLTLLIHLKIWNIKVSSDFYWEFFVRSFTSIPRHSCKPIEKFNIMN